MKKIIYTQRVDIVEGYKERRDCADQEIAKFIFTCGYLPIPVPNIPSIIREFIKELNPNGILLTGGNSLVKYGGNALERDEVDQILLDFALQKGIPILGFCRGMQSIIDYFEFPLEIVQKHVALKHKIIFQDKEISVNSYHNQGVKNVELPLIALAQTNDGIIEAIRHQSKRIMGVMWHPEREKPFNEDDIMLMKNFFL